MSHESPAQIPAEFGGDALAWATWLYYGEGRTQSSVASLLGVSRATIANYLAEGRRRGLVSVELAGDLLESVTLARNLASRWKLEAAHVIPSETDPEAMRNGIARAGGHALSRHLRDGAVIGVAWGRTVGQLAVSLPERHLPGVSIVQVSGSSLRNAEHSPEFCTTLIASRTGARAENLHAPALLSTREMRDALAREPGIAKQLVRITQCDTVVFGVGELDGTHVFADPDYMSREMAVEYMRLGATAILLGRCVDDSGREIEGPLSGRRMGMELADLAAVPKRLCVAGGSTKAGAIRAALTGGYVSELVTDAETARQLLEEMPE